MNIVQLFSGLNLNGRADTTELRDDLNAQLVDAVVELRGIGMFELANAVEHARHTLNRKGLQ